MKKPGHLFATPPGLTVPPGAADKIKDFLSKFKTFEAENEIPILLLYDKRSMACYLICHLESRILASKCDLDAVLDPEESEDYKLNRNIYTDNYAYKLMESDALKGRSFEDLVVEYDTSYRPEKPLKVFGGQHRITAIVESVKKGISVMHGIRVYFNLSILQKVEIAMVNNTSIAISNDLLDRMQEDLLGGDLRKWCQSVGLLSEGQNFADRRSPEGTPTVRLARTLIVNFYKGKEAKEDHFHTPIVCSSGPGVDESYQKVRDKIDWSDKSLKTMGEQFSRLRRLQRESVLNRDKDKYLEFANKAMHPCVTATWAYATGFFQRNHEALNAHYRLPDSVSPPQDPLNAKALLNARLKGTDPDTYRGLGARINNEELGRMLEVFLLQATKAKKPGITLDLANAAIKSYNAKKAKYEADKAVGKI
ncbi:MAG: hypothetical protein AB1502_03035 [Thermodesulfobacteriota bacterium]